jgi:hypothetical protein
MPTREQRQALAQLTRLGNKRQRQRETLHTLNTQIREAVLVAHGLGVPKSHIATAGHLSRQSVHTFIDNAEERGSA